MTNLLFCALMFSFFINFAVGSISYCGVNRTFLNIYRAIFESSAATIDEFANPTNPYYKKDVLERKLNEYFEFNLSRYVSKYETCVYYFNSDANQTVCTSNYCSNVKVSLSCYINLFFKYERSQDFSLVVTGL